MEGVGNVVVPILQISNNAEWLGQSTLRRDCPGTADRVSDFKYLRLFLISRCLFIHGPVMLFVNYSG
jgi:hypothetical protein